MRHHPWVYPVCGTCISMYVLEQYSINVSSVGWTNATQPRDIVSVTQTKPVAKCQSRVRIETLYGREGRLHSPSAQSSLPRCRVVITQREVLIQLGILSNANAVNPVRKALGIPSRLWRLWGKTPACSGVCQLDVKRNTELVNKGCSKIIWCRDQDW